MFVEDALTILKQGSSEEFENFFLKNVEDINSVINEFLIYAVELGIDYGEQYMALLLIDSLDNLSLKYSDAKSVRAFCNMSRADIYVANSAFDAALICLKEAMDVFEQIDDAYNLAECISVQAGIHEEYGNKEDALKLLNGANKILRALKREQAEFTYEAFVQNYDLIATIYYDDGDFNKAKRYYEIANRLTQKYDIESSVKNSFLNNFARYHVGNSNYSYAQELYGEIYESASKENQTELMFSALYNLADISLVIDDFEEGVKILQKAQSLAEQMNNPADNARCHQLMALLKYGIAKRDKLSFKKPLAELNKAKKILLRVEEKNLLGEVYFNIGNVIQDANPKKALHYYDMASPLINNYSYKHLIAQNTANIKLDESLYEQALKWFAKARRFLHADAYKELSDFYIDAGRMYYEMCKNDKAMMYYKKAIIMYKKIGNSLHIGTQGVFFKSKLKHYEDAIGIALEHTKTTDAFNFIEFSKSQSFLNMLNKKYLINENNLLDKSESYLEFGDIRELI
jgi:tetratricopeptide (TPR) repeat protein